MGTEILVFVVGLLIGAVVTFAIIKFADKNAKEESNVLIEQIQKEMQEQMQVYFENIANKALKENSQELSTQNKERLIELLVPFREQIEKFEKKVEENIHKETEQFSRLDTNIKYVLETGTKLSQQTTKLETTLKGDNKTQGRWGELVLERILEVSGLRKDEEYFTQKSFDGKRPDAVVLLPENRCIFVDAKTSLNHYDDYVNALDEIEKDSQLKLFKESIKNHISGLAKKEYQEITEFSSPDYVLMFIPIEGCYNLLFADDAQLWDFAWKNKIMPVCPSNLLATLKIINSFHTVNRQNKNALEIATLAGKMINKFVDLCADLQKVQTNLANALKKLDGRDNIIRHIERMEELGAKDVKQDSKKALAVLNVEENE